MPAKKKPAKKTASKKSARKVVATKLKAAAKKDKLTSKIAKTVRPASRVKLPTQAETGQAERPADVGVTLPVPPDANAGSEVHKTS